MKNCTKSIVKTCNLWSRSLGSSCSSVDVSPFFSPRSIFGEKRKVDRPVLILHYLFSILTESENNGTYTDPSITAAHVEFSWCYAIAQNSDVFSVT